MCRMGLLPTPRPRCVLQFRAHPGANLAYTCERGALAASPSESVADTFLCHAAPSPERDALVLVAHDVVDWAAMAMKRCAVGRVLPSRTCEQYQRAHREGIVGDVMVPAWAHVAVVDRPGRILRLAHTWTLAQMRCVHALSPIWRRICRPRQRMFLDLVGDVTLLARCSVPRPAFKVCEWCLVSAVLLQPSWRGRGLAAAASNS